MMSINLEIARLIDHTLLKPEATTAQIKTLCQEAITYHFATVCVNSGQTKLAAQMLFESDVKICTVVGFPLGANATSVKVFEAQYAIATGAKEIDMVINIGALKEGHDLLVKHDITSVVEICHNMGAICKVIIETALLTDEEKRRACQLAVQAHADFVKTSTGFSSGGATPEDVALMRQVVGSQVGVKAAGGMRSLADAQAMIAAGATRLGTSAGVNIVTAVKVAESGY